MKRIKAFLARHITRAQVGRFIRLTAMAATASGLMGAFLHGGITKATLIPMLTATFELMWRATFPTVPAPPAP